MVRLTADFGNGKILQNLHFIRIASKKRIHAGNKEKIQLVFHWKEGDDSSRFRVREEQWVLCNLMLEQSPEPHFPHFGDFFKEPGFDGTSKILIVKKVFETFDGVTLWPKMLILF